MAEHDERYGDGAKPLDVGAKPIRLPDSG